MNRLLFLLLIALNYISSAQTEQRFLETKNAYFGLTPPGLIPEVFAPGIVSDSTWTEHCQVAVSPKEDEIYWSAWSSKYPPENGKGNTEQIYFLEFREGAWTKPAVAEFEKDHLKNLNGGPVFSPDGNKLYFYSVDRPGGLGGMDTWYVDIKETGLSKPLNVGELYNSNGENWSPISTGGGNAYVNFDGTVKFKYDGEEFSKPDSIVIHKDFSPIFPIYVPSDESYVIFDFFKKDNFGDLDLYISFKTEEDKWGYPINMGAEINTELRERFPMVSPDGKYFFFMRHTETQDFFWVSTELIENFKTQSLINN